jgi:hypothetical protein
LASLKEIGNHLNPETSIEQSIDAIQNRITAVELYAMTLAGKRLAEIYGKDLSNYFYLEDANADLRKIHKAMNKANRENLQQMNSLFKGVTAEVYSAGKEMAAYKDTRLSPLASYRQEASPLLRQTMQNYEAMSKSVAVDETYKRTVRKYINRLAAGGEDNAPMAMRHAIRELTEQGISTIHYRSGRTVRMDTAVRNSLMTEYTNIVQNIQNKVGQEIGADGWEVSAHEHSAEDHIDLQGHTFTNEEFEKLQNGEDAEDIEGNTYQTDRPIGMWNCRHLAFPVIIGVSEPAFSDEQLEALQERNEDGVEFQGEHFTLYEAEQRQRVLETSMRRERENLNLLNGVKDTDSGLYRDYRESKKKLAALRNEYKELGAALHPKALRMKWERTYVPRGSTGSATLPD